MACVNLIVDGIVISPQEVIGLKQTYSQPQAQYMTRATDGSMITQDLGWQTLTIEISGQGLIPPGLQGIDYKGEFVIACIAPRVAKGGIPSFETVRGDVSSVVWSIQGGAYRPGSGGSNAVTVYWPQYTVRSRDGVQETSGVPSNSHDWSLTCETVDPL